MQFWKTITEKDKNHNTESMVYKIIQVSHFTDNFCSSSILLTWAEDGSSEQIAIRQPVASWRMICNEWKRQREYPNITSKHWNTAKKPLWCLTKLIKEWSSCESDIPYIKYPSVCACVIYMHICIYLCGTQIYLGKTAWEIN